MSAEAFGPYGYGYDSDGDVIAYQPGEGWRKVWGVFDGIGGIAQRVNHISGELANSAENVARGDRSLWEVRNDKENADQARFLQKLKTQRGDNVQLYYAGAAVALAFLIFWRD